MNDYLQTIFDKFELRVHKEYYYTADGLWTSVEGAKVRVGVTDYLQRTGGDVAFVDLVVKPGSTVHAQMEIGTLETSKTTVSLLSPVSGTVEEVNGVLLEKPELVNSDPYGDGWLIILTHHRLEDDLKSLMSADAYFTLMLKKLENEHKLESR